MSISSFEGCWHQQIQEARLLLTDACSYSCSWCAVHQYKRWEDITWTDYNEWALVQNIKLVRWNMLDVDDYWTLSHVLHRYFGTKDFTMTGGEPFLRREYRAISDEVKRQTQGKITALTKGEPLHRLLMKDRDALDSTDRVIFSIDTLSPSDHARINLPLMSQTKALWFLPKTVEAVSMTRELGKDVSINTVIPPDYHAAKKLIFELFRYGIEHDIEDIKLIELDTAAITVPYIESFLRAIVSEPELMELPVLWKDGHIPLWVKKAHALSLRTTNGKELKVSSYRLTCSHEHKQLDNETIKCCEMSKYGSLTINTTGEIIPCTGDPNKKISLREELKTKNIRGVIAKISAAILEIQEQKCPIFS